MSRPLVGVVATRGSTARLRPLARQLAREVTLCPLDRISGQPDAVLVASVGALDAVPPGVAAAVWLDDLDELDLVRSRPAVRVWLSADPAVVAAGAVAVPPEAIDVRAWPVMPPLIRARRRERLGLPADLVVTIGTSADLATLAVCAAAVVTGPPIVAGLALGTPMVCAASDVERLRLRAGEEVEVEAERVTAARIAADDEWAARLSVGARRAAEARFDVGGAAGAVLDRLGLGARATDHRLLAIMDARLAELDTPADATIRSRVLDATRFAAPLDRR